MSRQAAFQGVYTNALKLFKNIFQKTVKFCVSRRLNIIDGKYTEGKFMEKAVKRNLKIGVSKRPPVDGGIVSVRKFTLRERIMRWLLGDMRRVVVIVPGGDISDISIQEVADGGDFGDYV